LFRVLFNVSCSYDRTWRLWRSFWQCYCRHCARSCCWSTCYYWSCCSLRLRALRTTLPSKT